MIYSRSSLQPRNEVWGKVMFSQVFVGPRGGLSAPACITGHMTRGSLSMRVSVQGVSLSGGLCPWRGVSVHGGGSLSMEGVSVHGGGLCPWRGSLSMEGVSVHGGGLCQRGLCPGDLCQGDPHPPRERPPYGNERAVRIQVECIVV